MLTSMHRVYFDGNEGDGNGRYGLWLSKSEEDLSRIPDGPKQGLVITIYMIGEIETEAVLEWCGAPWNAWGARPVGPWRDNTETWE
jgi:hypothetical protein